MTRKTVDRIIDVSRELFAKKGYAATSVREISEKAGVNISAINYHFGNKQKLFNQIIQRSHQEMYRNVEQSCFSDETISVEEFALKMYELFLKKRTRLLHTFKILIGENSFINKETQALCSSGPPGEVFLIALFKRDYPNISEGRLSWASRCLFIHCIHMVLLKHLHENMPEIREGICDLISSLRYKLESELQ